MYNLVSRLSVPLLLNPQKVALIKCSFSSVNAYGSFSISCFAYILLITLNYRLRSALIESNHEVARLRADPNKHMENDDSGSERSMELVSPLQPTITLLLGPSSSEPPPLRSRSSSTSSSTAFLVPHAKQSVHLSDSDEFVSTEESVPSSSPALPVFSLGLGDEADTVELKRMRSALYAAETRLRTQDAELAGLREELASAAAITRTIPLTTTPNVLSNPTDRLR
jgi:hypothetical protein